MDEFDLFIARSVSSSSSVYTASNCGWNVSVGTDQCSRPVTRSSAMIRNGVRITMLSFQKTGRQLLKNSSMRFSASGSNPDNRIPASGWGAPGKFQIPSRQVQSGCGHGGEIVPLDADTENDKSAPCDASSLGFRLLRFSFNGRNCRCSSTCSTVPEYIASSCRTCAATLRESPFSSSHVISITCDWIPASVNGNSLDTRAASCRPPLRIADSSSCRAISRFASTQNRCNSGELCISTNSARL